MQTVGDLNNIFDSFNSVLGSDKDSKINENILNGLDIPKNIRTSYEKDLKGYIKELNEVADSGKKASAGIDGFNDYLAKNGQQTIKSTTIMQDFKNGIKSFGKTALSMVGNSVLDMAIGTGLQFVISGISDFIHREEIAIEKGQKAQSTISDTFNTFSSGKSTISNLGKSFSSSTDQINTTSDAINHVAQRYTELSKGVDSKTNKNVSLSSEDYQNYLDLSNQLAQLYPRLQSSTDSQGNAILDLGNDAKSAARSIQELYNAQMLSSNVKIGAELQDALKGTSTQIKQYNEEIDKYDKQSKKAEESAKSFASVQNQFKLPEADDDYKTYFEVDSDKFDVSAKYCYAAHESRLHQNDRCKRFTLCLVLTVRFRSLAPWGKLFQLFI